MTDEREKNLLQSEEIWKLRQRNELLEKENKEREMKYVDMYHENTQQHDKICELQA